jgi:hypothetical protein
MGNTILKPCSAPCESAKDGVDRPFNGDLVSRAVEAGAAASSSSGSELDDPAFALPPAAKVKFTAPGLTLIRKLTQQFD